MSRFNYKSKVMPGQMIDIIAGINLNLQDPFNKTLLKGSNESIPKDIEEGFFQEYPQLTPCKNWSELVYNFFSNYKVNDRESSFFGSAVSQKHALNHKEITIKLAEHLGIPIDYAKDDSRYSFVLVRVYRDMPNSKILLSSNGKNVIEKFYNEKLDEYDNSYDRDCKNLYMKNPKGISNTLKFVNEEVGSHYIESITIGDMLFQVFIYEALKYKIVCDIMDASGWEDVNALDFRFLTSSAYCHHVGKVCIASKDKYFESLRKNLKDPVYNIDESVFIVLVKKELQEEIRKLNDLVCIGCELECISNLENVERNGYNNIKKQWFLNEIVVQSSVTRFGIEGAGPIYYNAREIIDYKRIYKAFISEKTLSIVWSPFLSVSQMYVNLNELFSKYSLNERDVKHLIVTADVIEVSEDLDLSSLDNLMLGCRVFVGGREGKLPQVTLSSKAWNTKKLYCDNMDGNCIFRDKENEKNRILVFDYFASSFMSDEHGVSYNDFFAGKFPIDIFFNEEINTYVKWCKEAVKNGLQTLLMSAIIPVSAQAVYDNELKLAATESWNCLNWISEYSTKIVEKALAQKINLPEEVYLVYTHSEMALNDSANPNDINSTPIPDVPVLRYTAYDESINRLLTLSKDYNEQIREIKNKAENKNNEIKLSYIESERDENIKQIAKFMNEQNEAFAKREDDLNASHKEIIEKKEQMIDKLEGRIVEVNKDLQTRIDNLEDAKDALKLAVDAYMANEIIKATFQGVSAIVGASINVFSSYTLLNNLDNFKEIDKVLKKLEAFMKIVDSLDKLARALDAGQNIADYAQELIDVKKVKANIQGEHTEPTDTDWDIFMNECIAQVNPLSAVAREEVERYISSLKNLVIIGKLKNSVVKQKSQYEYDIFEELSTKKVSENQSERLRKLVLNIDKPNWSPNTDYLADLGQLDALLQQKENQAILKLVDLMRLQNSSMTFHYLSKPTVITSFDLISIEDALSRQALAAVESLENYPHPPTDILEPIEIEIKDVFVENLISDEGIEIEIPMSQDLFDTLCRVRINSIDVRVKDIRTGTGKCHVKMESLGNPMYDRGLDREILCFKTISREWNVVYSIESGKTLIGTKPTEEWGRYFTKPTPFQKFRISVPDTKYNKCISFPDATTSITLSFMVEGMYSPTRERIMPRLRLSAPDSFISQLKGKSITNGWDVVSFISINKINALWKVRWEKEMDKAYKGDRMFIQSIVGSFEEGILNGTIKYEFNADLGSPWIEFSENDTENALVKIPIIKGIFRTITTKKSGDIITKEYTIVQDPNNKPLIKTKTPLQKLKLSNADNSIYIQLGDQPFTTEAIEIDPVLQVAINHIIATYLKTKKLNPWILGTLKYSTNIEYLKPKDFKFKVFVSKNYPSVLGLYILTITKDPPEGGIRQTWTENSWIVSSEMDAAVYFSEKLFFEKELKPAIGDATLNSVDRKIILNGAIQVYNERLKFKEGVFGLPGCKTVYKDAIVNFELKNIDINLKLNEITYNCDTKWVCKFPCQETYMYGGYPCPTIEYVVKWVNVTFTCNFSASSKPVINKNNFEVTFTDIVIEPKVTVTPEKSKSGLWVVSPAKISEDVVKNMKSKLEEKLKNMKIHFQAMPMFAVSNVLYPESKVMDPQGVYLPGDLVILGSGAVDKK